MSKLVAAILTHTAFPLSLGHTLEGAGFDAGSDAGEQEAEDKTILLAKRWAGVSEEDIELYRNK
jgi:hypothetical protein